MIDPATLKPGDVIAHNDPYPGEGEKIIAVPEVPQYPGHALVITACSKFESLNGHQIYMDHEVIEQYYHKAETKAHDHTRRLALMFLQLPSHIKAKIAFDLKLMEDYDSDQPEIEKTRAYFRRAVESGLLKDLWDKVAGQRDVTEMHNPFYSA